MALDNDRAADLYEITQEMTTAGLPAYEISARNCWARMPS